jgi:hypothetical protein
MQSQQQVCESGFSGPAAAYQRDRLTGKNFKVDILRAFLSARVG